MRAAIPNLLLLTSLAFAAGCGGESGAGSRPAAEPLTEGEGSLEDEVGEEDEVPSPPPTSSSCEAIASRFRAVMQSAPGRCEADADCACYNPVVAEVGCGGVTDRASADRLRQIEGDFHAASCPWPHQCAAQACEPVCRDGRCQ